MNARDLRFAVCTLGVLVSCGATAGATSEREHVTEARREFASMHWRGGSQTLAASHGTFAVPAGGSMVVGTEAERADELINGTTSSDTEGFARIDHRVLYLSYSDVGYVSADDWKDVDASELLKNMSQATEDANEERVKNGVSAMHTDGWVQAPVYDANRKSVRWVVGLHDSETKFVNAVALQLGRNGYERFTLVSDGSNPQADAAILANAVRAYQFKKGFRFSDYVQGDKLAGFGIAALVGTAAGATIAKTVGFGAVLLLIKKFFILILAAGAGAWGYVKRFFAGNKMQVGPPKALPDAASPPG
jgi:uncharacterized membrane-anchored protein